MKWRLTPDSTSRAQKNCGTPETMYESVRVNVSRTLDEIEPLRAFWCSCPGVRDSDIDILTTAQRTSGDAVSPYVLSLYRGERLDTVLVGRIVRRQLPFQIGYFNLTSPPIRIIVFPYGALRGNESSENCRALIREVMRSLKNREADLAILEHIRVDSLLLQYGRAQSAFLFRDRYAPVRPHFKRELPNTVAELRASLSSSERTRFRQIARKLSADFAGKIDLAIFESAQDLDRMIHDVEEVAKKTWQRKLGLGGFNTSAALRARLGLEAKQGWLRGYIVYLSGKPVAFWLGAIYQKNFYSDFTGYDPDYAKYSLGTHLLSIILEDLCLHQVRAFDFGFTDDEYKRRFGNVMWTETSLHLFPATFRGLRFSMLRLLTALISNTSRTLLRRTGLMQKVKRLWRHEMRGSARQKTS